MRLEVRAVSFLDPVNLQGSTYPEDHEKVGTGQASSSGPPSSGRLAQWRRRRRHLPFKHLEVCAIGFLDPVKGSTYPRDHLKVAQGPPSCALPQVAVNLEENVRTRDGGRGTHFD